MRRSGPPASAILRKVAEDGADFDVGAWPSAYVHGLINAGLGPIVRRLAGPRAPALADDLLAADLTAQVLTSSMLEAVEEILRALGPDAAEIILLKGVAACQRHYPEPHLRVMGDIDVLAPQHLYLGVQSTLRQLGYVQTSDLPAEFFETHHHAMPFWHPLRRVWVEVHHSLFPPQSTCGNEPCFSRGTIMDNSIPISLAGISARCLRDELHLLYICSHWARGPHLERALVPIIDVIYLFKTAPAFDWGWVQRAAGSGYALRYLSLMLGYLRSRRIIELAPAVDTFVARGIGNIGRLNAKILYRLIDRHFVDRSRHRMLSEDDLAIVWDTLLRDRSAYVNLSALPLVLLSPRHRRTALRGSGTDIKKI